MLGCSKNEIVASLRWGLVALRATYGAKNWDGWKILYLIPGDETADGRRDVNCGTDLDRSDKYFYHSVMFN